MKDRKPNPKIFVQPPLLISNKRTDNYFTKANDIYDLGDSFPSLYCASITGSEIAAPQQ